MGRAKPSCRHGRSARGVGATAVKTLPTAPCFGLQELMTRECHRVAHRGKLAAAPHPSLLRWCQSPGMGCPQRWESLFHWRYSEPVWMLSCAVCWRELLYNGDWTGGSFPCLSFHDPWLVQSNPTASTWCKVSHSLPQNSTNTLGIHFSSA